MPKIEGRKVITTTQDEVSAFNRAWPCSELQSTRHYWFEFDADGNLVDTDVPEQDDGSAASAMAADCRALLIEGTYADWMGNETITNPAIEALKQIAALDPHKDSINGWNEWGEADCFNQAQKIAKTFLKTI